MTASVATGVKAPRVTKVASLATMMPAFLSPMKAMKKPIPAEVLRDAAHDLLADVEDGEEDEDDPLDEDRRQCGLPAVAHAHDEGEGKEGVDPHAGGLGEGQLGEEGDEQRPDGGRQSCGREDSPLVHARRAKDVGVDS